MIELAVLLAVPLALRYFATGRMRRLRDRLVREDEEYRQLRVRYEHTADVLRQTRHQLRYYEVRKERLNADLRADHHRLRDLRAATAERKAA